MGIKKAKNIISALKYSDVFNRYYLFIYHYCTIFVLQMFYKATTKQ